MRSLSYLGWRHKESFPLGMSHALRQAERAGQLRFVSTAAVKSFFPTTWYSSARTSELRRS